MFVDISDEVQRIMSKGNASSFLKAMIYIDREREKHGFPYDPGLPEGWAGSSEHTEACRRYMLRFN